MTLAGTPGGPPGGSSRRALWDHSSEPTRTRFFEPEVGALPFGSVGVQHTGQASTSGCAGFSGTIQRCHRLNLWVPNACVKALTAPPDT